MSSALELEKKLEILTDQVHDIFHAISLNIEALRVQTSHKNIPKEMEQVLQSCSVSLDQLKQLLDERSTLRLNYLITEQIKEEEAKVRRQRLNDYEQKILDQRRLISDKQAFYENLLRPKKKRPPNMPLEEFQDLRRKEISEQQNRKYQALKSQVTRLNEFYMTLKQENDKMESELNQLEEQKQKQEENRYDISEHITKSQQLYGYLNEALICPDLNKYKDIFEAIEQAKAENEKMFKEYEEEKQMEQYLRWEKEKLVNQYKLAKKQLQNCRNQKKQNKPIFKRPVSR